MRFLKNKDKTYDFKQLADILELKDTKTRNRLIRLLGQMTAKNELTQIDAEHFKFNTADAIYTGKVDMTSRGDAYIVVDELDDDIFVDNKNLNHALDGDEVEVFIFKNEKNQNQKEKSQQFFNVLKLIL